MDYKGYKEAYKILFNAITDATREIEKSETIPPETENGLTILKESQSKTENLYVDFNQ